MTELNANGSTSNTHVHLVESQGRNNDNPSPGSCSETIQNEEEEKEEDELRRLLVPKLEDLPHTPPSAIETNFVTYYAPGESNIFLISIHLLFCKNWDFYEPIF